MKDVVTSQIEVLDNNILLIYTPLCGTCSLAKRIMNLVEQTYPLPFYNQVNLGLNKELANKYIIESVPCLVIIKDGVLLEKIYAFESVTNIYNRIVNYFPNR